MSERWLPVVGWVGLYEVSDLGRVRCLRRHRVCERILRPSAAGVGYRKVQLSNKGRHEHRYVHDLVLSAFVGPRPPGLEAAHGNGKRDDNRLLNLRWDTRAGNHSDKHHHGTMCRGDTHGRAKLTSAQVIAIRAALGTCREVGERFSVSQAQVSRIRRGKNWSHVV